MRRFETDVSSTALVRTLVLKTNDRLVENRRFQTTQWSLVKGAFQTPAEQARNAWNELFQTYWYPLYAYCRRQGRSHADAQDLTQGFCTHLLTSSGLTTVSPTKGRFRSFLLASLRNYMANQVRSARTIRRGGAHQFFSLHADDVENRFSSGNARCENPELAYEREWVAAILKRTRDRLAEDYRRAERQELFALLEPHMMAQDDALPRLEIGEQLKLSRAAIAMSIHRMRKRFGEILLSEVQLTVDDPADVEDELQRLMLIAGGRY